MNRKDTKTQRTILLSLSLCAFAVNPAAAQVTGDECLFCHRNDIGPAWQKNRHGTTIRVAGEEYLLGTRRLKQQGYGKFAILSGDRWDPERFAGRCAGCHASGVDPATRAFAAFGIECYACHGDVDLEHTKDTALVWFSKKRPSDARAATSLCAGCHLRGARSRSTGLPYPTRVAPGHDLLADLEADWTKAGDPALNAGDRHVWRNARDVLVRGDTAVTCLSCHQVHTGSSVRHRRLLRGAACEDCHQASGPMKVLKRYQVHSAVCEY